VQAAASRRVRRFLPDHRHRQGAPRRVARAGRDRTGCGLMLDGRPLVDVHLHPARLDTLKPSWDVWIQGFDSPQIHALYDGPAVDAGRFDAMLAAEGVDVAIVLAEYSPKVTGV